MKYTQEQVSQAMEGSPALWAIKHQIKNEVGFPIEFQKRKFLFQIYNDLSHKQVILKPPQVGMTVCNILKAFYIAKKLRRQIIYTLPTMGDVQDMVGGSFNRIIAQNPILQEWTKDHDTVEQKQVGEAMIFYRGTFTAKQAMMIPSGLNIHDEVDASDPEVITQYENRLQAQEDGGWRWYFSHPSLAGHGVDVYWQQSDKKEWFIKCKNGHRQNLQWPRNVSLQSSTYICCECGVELSDSERINGAWESTASGDFSGYHISQLMLYNKSAKDIIKAFNDPQKDKQYFYNYVLGLPYIGSEDRIEASVVLRNCVDIPNDYYSERAIIGADTSHGINYVMMNTQGVFYYDRAETITASKDPYDAIRDKLRRFEKSIAVFDQGGDLIGVRKLQAEYPGRVFLCFYQKDRKSNDYVRWGENEDYGIVRVDRNRHLTLLIEQIRDTGRIRLNGTREEWADFAEQFNNIYREVITIKSQPEKDDKTLYGNEYVWKRNGHDDYCFVEGTKVMTEIGEKNIEDIEAGTMVLTRKGYKKVYHSGATQKQVSVMTAYFSNGSSFTATPGHLIITKSGKIRLDCIDSHAILYVCLNQKQLSTTEQLIGDTQTLPKDNTEFIICDTTSGKKIQFRFIVKFGLIPMALFLRGLSYIIKTAIHSITILQTWYVNREDFIKNIILAKNSKTLLTEQDKLNIWRGLEVNLTRGARPPKENNGIANTLSKVLYWLNPKLLFVLSVMLKALHEAIKAVSFVPPDVVIVGTHANGEKRTVYNIAVESESEYFANGILVSNCHALGYAMIGMQKFSGQQARIFGTRNALYGIQKAQMVEADGTVKVSNIPTIETRQVILMEKQAFE